MENSLTPEALGFKGVVKDQIAPVFKTRVVVTTERYNPPAANGYIDREIIIEGYPPLYLHIIYYDQP